jgi:hypothetical protein
MCIDYIDLNKHCTKDPFPLPCIDQVVDSMAGSVLLCFLDYYSGYHQIALVRHGYPWVPTDQAHGRPRQVGPAYQKTRRPISGPNRPSWRPTRPPEDLLEDPSDDLIQHNLKT